MKNCSHFLVALHTATMNQAMEQAKRVLFPGGADGVILVNYDYHILSTDEAPNLFDIAKSIKRQHPKHMVGINPFDIDSGKEALREFSRRKLNILWRDNGGIEESGNEAFLSEEYIKMIKKIKGPKRKYFGGVSFKYQSQEDLELVTKTAAEHFHAVIIGSGKNGPPPPIDTIIRMREVMTNKNFLGIASGITVENIDQYLPYTDIFIIGTGIAMNQGNGTDAFYYDSNKVAEIRNKIEAYKKTLAKIA